MNNWQEIAFSTTTFDYWRKPGLVVVQHPGNTEVE